MQALKEWHLKHFSFILTDKDFSKINATQTVWPKARLQLYIWHVRSAIKQWLASNKISIYYSYNPKIAYEECSLIDPNWGIIDNSNSEIFCPLNLRKTIVELVENHSNCHMLLPNSNGSFITNGTEIWKECVGEIFQFCKNNNLLWL